MSETRSVTMTFGYSNTDVTRKYKFDVVSEEALEAAKDKILAINASLKAGTDGGLSTFFRSDDYDATDPENVVGLFTGIVAAQTDEVEATDIDLGI